MYHQMYQLLVLYLTVVIFITDKKRDNKRLDNKLDNRIQWKFFTVECTKESEIKAKYIKNWKRDKKINKDPTKCNRRTDIYRSHIVRHCAHLLKSFSYAYMIGMRLSRQRATEPSFRAWSLQRNVNRGSYYGK